MKSRSGFTIVEIMLVIIILGLLAAIVTVGFVGEQKRVRDTKRINDLITLSEEFRSYYESNGNYPLTCDMSSLPAAFSCSSGIITTTYSGYKTPPIIAPTTSSAQLRSSFANLTDNFGDPKAASNHPPINRMTSSRVHTNTYFVFSPDLLPNNSLYGGTRTITFYTNSRETTTFTCQFTVRSNVKGSADAKPHQYVMGYFSENEDRWRFFVSDINVEVHPLVWGGITVGPTHNCASQSINALRNLSSS